MISSSLLIWLQRTSKKCAKIVKKKSLRAAAPKFGTYYKNATHGRINFLEYGIFYLSDDQEEDELITASLAEQIQVVLKGESLFVSEI